MHALFTLRGGHTITGAPRFYSEFPSALRCRKHKVPAAGIAITEFDAEKQQLKLT